MGETDGSIEDPDSNFNQHRLAVIRYSIEKNLSIAIANYNNYTGVPTELLMPQLKEDEWSKIINNISIISFLQGLNIGGKVYNGYSIINNTKNEEYVSEDSIYIADNKSVTEVELKDADEAAKAKYKFGEGIFGNYNNYTVSIGSVSYNGIVYNTVTQAENIKNVIIYYSGDQSNLSDKKGYYKFVATQNNNGNMLLNNTDAWEYLGESYDNLNYYKITDLNINGDIIGVLNTDFERRSYVDEGGTTRYYYPKEQLGSYSSIVNESNVDTIDDGNIYKYVDTKSDSIRKAYYTALGRERYSMYRGNNKNYESTSDESMPVINFYRWYRNGFISYFK